jgi:hypothetical protein
LKVWKSRPPAPTIRTRLITASRERFVSTIIRPRDAAE